MFKILLPLTLTVILAAPSHSMTIKEFDHELKKSRDIMVKEMKRLESLLPRLTLTDINKLNNTYIGDESMTEADILIMSSDQVLAGLDNFQFYLDHTKDGKKSAKRSH